MTLPEKVRELVGRFGGLASASRTLGIPYATLSDLAYNEHRDPRYSTLRKIAKADGKTAWQLLKEIEDESPPVRTTAA